MSRDATCMPPFSSCFVDSFKALITSKEVWVPPSCHLVFLCGKRLDLKPSARAVFLKYARKHIRHSYFFLAEDVFQALRRIGESLDLLTIESHLARCADSVIIILESDGAKVELGAFAHEDDLAKILLVINEDRYRGGDSFICEGPLKKLDRMSDLGPTLYTRFESIARVHHVIEERLQKLRGKNRKRLSLATASDFERLPRSRRIFFLADLIWLLSPVTYRELISLFKAALGETRYDFLKFDLSLLQSLGFAARHEIAPKVSYYLSALTVPYPFCQYDRGDPFAVRAEAIGNYHKRARARLALLKDRRSHA